MPVLSNTRKEALRKALAELAAENRGAPETLRTRGVAVKSWRRFAGRETPTKELVVLYAVDELMKNRKPTGIRCYLSGIKKHFKQRVKEFDVRVFESAELKETLKQGDMRLRKAGCGTKRAVVVSEEEVKRICESAESFDDVLFAAVVVASFFNLTRGAELVLPAHLRSQKLNKVPLFGNVTTSRAETQIRLVSQKNDQYRALDLSFNRQNTPRWGRHLLFRYMCLRGECVELEAYPQCFLREGGIVPTTSWLMKRLKGALGQDYTIHGLRAGGATRLAELGYSAFFIQLAGRWSSDAFLSYIANTPTLAAELARKNNLPYQQKRGRRS